MLGAPQARGLLKPQPEIRMDFIDMRDDMKEEIVAEVASPCIKLCKIDQATGLCSGCLRSLAEISVWSRASNSVKLEILHELAQRREKSGVCSSL